MDAISNRSGERKQETCETFFLLFIGGDGDISLLAGEIRHF